MSDNKAKTQDEFLDGFLMAVRRVDDRNVDRDERFRLAGLPGDFWIDGQDSAYEKLKGRYLSQ